MKYLKRLLEAPLYLFLNAFIHKVMINSMGEFVSCFPFVDLDMGISPFVGLASNQYNRSRYHS